MDEIEAALLTNLENKDGIDRSQIAAADHIYAANTAFDQIHTNLMKKEEAIVAWEEEFVKQQDESTCLQFATKSIYFEDRTIDVDTDKNETILQEDGIVDTMKLCRVLGLDDMRRIVMGIRCVEVRFSVLGVLKSLHNVIDMITLDVCLSMYCIHSGAFSCCVETDALLTTPLTDEIAQNTIENSKPLSIRFNRQASSKMPSAYILSFVIEKS